MMDVPIVSWPSQCILGACNIVHTNKNVQFENFFPSPYCDVLSFCLGINCVLSFHTCI